MEFTYKTATGNVTIDVAEEWVAILKDCDRQEYNNDHTETRRHYHLEALEYEGADYGKEDEALERLLETDAARSILKPALQALTPKQRDVIEAIFYKGVSVKDYATSRGVTGEAITKTKTAALKKMEKFLADG